MRAYKTIKLLSRIFFNLLLSTFSMGVTFQENNTHRTRSFGNAKKKRPASPYPRSEKVKDSTQELPDKPKGDSYTESKKELSLKHDTSSQS